MTRRRPPDRLAIRVNARAGAVALMLLGGAAPACADDALMTQLVGKTLSAVVYASASPGPVSGHSLQRIVLQAYLEPGGRALLRQWVSARDSYTAPVQGHWSLAADNLCIDLPAGPLCAKIHVWGPRIAGIGVQPYAMLDGDLRPGNAVTGSR